MMPDARWRMQKLSVSHLASTDADIRWRMLKATIIVLCILHVVTGIWYPVSRLLLPARSLFWWVGFELFNCFRYFF